MTAQLLLIVLLLLVVKYTFELASRTSSFKPFSRRRARSRPDASSPSAQQPASPPAAPVGITATGRRAWAEQIAEIERLAAAGGDWASLIDQRVAELEQMRARFVENAPDS